MRLDSRLHAAALAIAAGLPEWFTPNGLRVLAEDLLRHEGLVVDVDGTAAGFISFAVSGEIARIGWMAVRRDHHRRGLGRRLIEAMCEAARQLGARTVEVDTLGDSVDYLSYEKTRAFYRAVGFTEVRRVMQDDPEWPDRLTLARVL